MEKDIILKLNIDTSDSVSELEKVEQAFADIDKKADETGDQMAALSKKMEMLKGAALKAGATSPVGKEAIKRAAELNSELNKINELVNRNNTDFDTFRSVVGIGQTAINSYGAFQSVSALVGVENEKLLQTMVKLQAAQQLLNSLEAAKQSLMTKNAVVQKAQIALQKAYALAVGTSTTGMKVFRLALISTGIGALIVGLGLLVANFEKVSTWVKKTIERFEFLKIVFYQWYLLYMGVRKALEELGIVDTEQTKIAKENAEKRIKSLQEEEKAIGSRYDFEIAKAKAAGENTFKLEEKKRAALAERLKAEAQAILALVKLNGEFTDEQKERVKELSEMAVSLTREGVVARITEEKRLTDEHKKQVDERAKNNEKTAQEYQKKLKEEQDLADAQFELMNELTMSAQQKEVAELNKFYEEKYAIANGNAELEKKLAEKQAQDIAAINQRYADEKLNAEYESALRMRDLRMELKELNAGELSENASPEEVAAYYENKRIVEEEAYANQLQDMRDRAVEEQLTKQEVDLQSEVLDAQHKARLTENAKQQAEALKKIEEGKAKTVADNLGMTASLLSQFSSIAGESTSQGKAFAVAAATISTYLAAQQAYTSQLIPGDPTSPIRAGVAAGMAVISGLMNVQKIIAVKTPKAVPLPSIGASSFTRPSTGGAGAGGGQPVNPDGTLTADLLNNPQQNRVVVLESDIQRATERNANSVSISEL